MNVFDLYAKISLDTSEYESGLEGASGKTSSFGSGLKSAFSTIASVGATALTAATTAVIAFGKSAVDAGSQFDSSMSQVAATMGVTVDEIGNLRDFALDMGAKTAFSATQAADALNYMALAGYDADEAMQALPNVLNLAAAGGIELAYASDMVTDAQSALGLSMEESAELVDKMAMASSKSNTSVAQLGEAILTVGGTAKTLAGGTTELSTALGILADNGVKGAEGGTALRNVILSLSAPTDTAAQAMQNLGLEVFDSEGNMRSLNDIFGDLNGTLSTMTQGEQTQVLNEIFNKVDLKSVNALLANTGDRFNELSGYIDNAAGAAEKMANTQLDNLNGDVTLFKSALEGAQILVSDKLTPSLREFVQFGTEGLTRVSDAFKEGGLSGAMEAFGDVLSDALNMMISMLPQMVDAGAQLLGAVGQGIISNLPTIMDAAIQVATMFAGYIIEAAPNVISAATQIITSLLDGLTAAMPQLLPAAIQAVDQIATGIIENAPSLLDSAIQMIVTLGDGIISALPELAERIPEIITTIVDTLTESFPEVLAAGVELLGALIDAIPTVVTNLLGALPNLITSITSFLTTNVPVVVQAAITLLNGIVEAIPQVVSSLVAALPEIVTAIVNYLTENYPVVLDGAIQLFLAIVQAIPQIVVELVGALPEIIGTIVQALWDSGPDILDAAVQMFMNIVNAIPEFLGSLVEGLGSIGSTIIGWLTGTGSEVSSIAKGTTDDVVSSYNTMGSQLDTSLSGTESNVSGHFNSMNNAVSGSLDGTVSAANTKFGQINTDIDGSVSKSKSSVDSGFGDMKTSISEKTEAAATDVEQKYTKMNTTIDEKMKTSKTSVDESLAQMQTAFSDGLNGMLTNTSSIFDSIHNAMVEKLTAAKDSVQNLINQIRAAFNFEWSLPYLKLPHIQIHGEFSLETPSAPTFSVSWYRKAMGTPMLLSGATIFGAMGGQLLGGGESGQEIVAGKETLMGMIRDAAGTGNDEMLSLLRRIAELLNTNGTVVNLTTPSGEQLASYMFNPLAKYAKANGTPIINAT